MRLNSYTLNRPALNARGIRRVNQAVAPLWDVHGYVSAVKQTPFDIRTLAPSSSTTQSWEAWLSAARALTLLWRVNANGRLTPMSAASSISGGFTYGGDTAIAPLTNSSRVH